MDEVPGFIGPKLAHYIRSEMTQYPSALVGYCFESGWPVPRYAQRWVAVIAWAVIALRSCLGLRVQRQRQHRRQRERLRNAFSMWSSNISLRVRSAATASRCSADPSGGRPTIARFVPSR